MEILDSLVKVEVDITFTAAPELLSQVLDLIKENEDELTLPGEWDDRLMNISTMMENGYGLNEADSNFLRGLYLVLGS